MRRGLHGVSGRPSRWMGGARLPLSLGVISAVFAVSPHAEAQVGSANVPLPNVLILLDTSGSFEHMIDGSNPEDPANNVGPTYASCEQAWTAASLNPAKPIGVPATPNRWGVAVQALTGTILDNDALTPFYSCTTMDRQLGPVVPPPATPGGVVPGIPFASFKGNGLDAQYGIHDAAGNFYYPYDSGYYLPFHRPVARDTKGNRCVYSPVGLPGANGGGVGLTGGGILPSFVTDYPTGAIATYEIDKLFVPGTSSGIPITSALTTPNFGFSSNSIGTDCVFNQASDGIIDQASTLVRFGLMTFDNDTDFSTGTDAAAQYMVSGTSPFLGQWSYHAKWDTAAAANNTPPVLPLEAPSVGLPSGCTTGKQTFELGARNAGAPPWEGRLIGFPAPNADVNATVQNNALIQTTINSMRPYGATPTAALLTDAEYYFRGDPTGPGPLSVNADPLVTGGCRPQYQILLTDGAPNQDMRPNCQAGTGTGPTKGICPYQLPEDTAYVMANGVGDQFTGLGASPPVFTYVIGFAVSGNEMPSGTTTLSGCAAFVQTSGYSTLQAACQATATNFTQGQDAGSPTLESPCCSLERIAVAGGTGHAYFADTPGDLNAALAAVLGDITGQIGSRTIPVASPTISYATGSPTTASFLSSFTAATCSTTPTPGQVPCAASVGPWTGDIFRQDYQCTGGATPPTATTLTGDDFNYDLIQQSAANGRHFLFYNGSDSTGTLSTNALTIRPYLTASSAITNSVGTLPTPDKLDSFGAQQKGTEISNFFSSISSIYGALDPPSGAPLSIQSTSCQDPATGGYLDQTSCANLALSFAMAQPTFNAVNAAAGSLKTSYATSTHPGVPATNRSGAPMGAILDSTPAVVGPPAAQVRDDSYQAFVTGLSAATPARDTMLYVATIDGQLHAFDTSVGTASVPVAAGETWTFLPPAVLPRLISEYPGGSNILLDGSPVVKDVVFNRADPPTSAWVQSWHTMLVAGFGQGGRGYYALDVTDPRLPPSQLAAPPALTTVVSPTTNPPTVNKVGPQFQWQITSVNLVGTSTSLNPPTLVPNEIFGKISATPAIATVYADPTGLSGANPVELGVAILPGGRDGFPVPASLNANNGFTGMCQRELASPHASSYQTSSPLFVSASSGATLPGSSPFNVSDPAFPPRGWVRQWATNCTGPKSAVPGRSMMVVSIATGQILALFARGSGVGGAGGPPVGFLNSDPTMWDVPTDGNGNPLVGKGVLIPTPLDSPMTGTPVVYPSGVGVVAQAVYVGDADGTMWRFNISDPNPRNWSGAIFADAYSPGGSGGHGADVSGGDTYGSTLSAPDWPALDSQAISVEPQVALDSNANVVVDFATGDQTAFNACYSTASTVIGNHGINCLAPAAGALGETQQHPTTNFLYSVHEVRGVGASALPYQAKVNWFNEWTTGERVTGPMAIFNGVLYFATYLPPGNSAGDTPLCGGGGASLYAWDYSAANPLSCSNSTLPIGCGGVQNPNQDPGFPTNGQETSTTLGITTTTVIPGVAISSAPNCTTVTPGVTPDTYTGALHDSIGAQSPGNFSLVANIGKSSKNNPTANLIKQKVKTPTSPTLVDSWAAIAE